LEKRDDSKGHFSIQKSSGRGYMGCYYRSEASQIFEGVIDGKYMIGMINTGLQLCYFKNSSTLRELFFKIGVLEDGSTIIGDGEETDFDIHDNTFRKSDEVLNISIKNNDFSLTEMPTAIENEILSQISVARSRLTKEQFDLIEKIYQDNTIDKNSGRRIMFLLEAEKVTKGRAN